VNLQDALRSLSTNLVKCYTYVRKKSRAAVGMGIHIGMGIPMGIGMGWVWGL